MAARDDARAIPRGRFVVNAFILLYLSAQLVVPLRGFVDDKLDSRGNFSWNMYSKRYECRELYLATYADGVREVDIEPFFKRAGRSRQVFHRDILPRFHAFLCDELKRDGELRRLEGVCLCSLNETDFIPLIRDDVDLCAAPNYGVLER